MEAAPVTITLCMIVGNEADIIVRCLDAFAAGFDRLSIVRASGALVPDDTIERAEFWCRQHGKVFAKGEYRNDPEAEPWKHVDSFAGARNLSFRGAGIGSDWLLWADADDIIENAGKLREAAAKAAPEIDVLFFPYRVPGTEKNPIRERMIRHSLWLKGRAWRYAVHENFHLAPEDKTEVFMEPVWVHAPAATKGRSHERNLRILNKSVEDMGSYAFYLHNEWFLMGQREAAKRFAEIALLIPSLEPSFRYEILLNNSKMADNPRFKMEEAAKAFAVMPHCREAMAAMILTCFEVGDMGKALALSERMIATPEPLINARPWTHEAKWYGWAGWDLRARVLRMVGRMEDAGYAQTMATFGRPVISLIHATNGDPNAAYRTRERWLSAAARPQRIQHVFAILTTDPDSMDFARQFEHAEAASPDAAWDAAAAISKGHLLVQVCDRSVPCWAWDDELMAVLKASAHDVTQDPIAVRVRGLEAIICSRNRWQDQGRKFMAPDFFERAKADGILIEAPNIEFLRVIDRAPNSGNTCQTSTLPKSMPTLPRSARLATEAKEFSTLVELPQFTESLRPKTPTLPSSSTVGMMTEPPSSISTEPPLPQPRT